jgi:hypothetical protein
MNDVGIATVRTVAEHNRWKGLATSISVRVRGVDRTPSRHISATAVLSPHLHYRCNLSNFIFLLFYRPSPLSHSWLVSSQSSALEIILGQSEHKNVKDSDD